MNNESLQHLLEKVALINANYEKIAEITGENFNVFEILGKKEHENSHSMFIAELLNPNGLHSLGSTFLKLFYEQIIKQVIPGFNCEFANVEIEKHIANKNQIEKEDDPSGRIDVFLKDKFSNVIVIENKIWASDQAEQLVRYFDYCKEQKFPKFMILYLKPFGGNASEESTTNTEKTKKLKSNSEVSFEKNETPDYYCISYSTDILKWLEVCIEKTTYHPLLRETINQYLNLIRKITNQSKNKTMENDIKEVLFKDASSIKASLLISTQFEKNKNQIMNKFWEDTVEFIKRERRWSVRLHKYSLLLIETKDGKFMGIEPLNEYYFIKSKTYIGIFHEVKWSKKKDFKFNFTDLEWFLPEIINPEKKKILKQDILVEIENYLSHNSDVKLITIA